MQAEYVRVPYAHVNLVKLPESVTDDQAILMSDIFPTGYMAAVVEGDTVVLAIDAVGVDAERPHSGPGAKKAAKQAAEFEKEKNEIAPEQNPTAPLTAVIDAYERFDLREEGWIKVMLDPQAA